MIFIICICQIYFFHIFQCQALTESWGGEENRQNPIWYRTYMLGGGGRGLSRTPLITEMISGAMRVIERLLVKHHLNKVRSTSSEQ